MLHNKYLIFHVFQTPEKFPRVTMYEHPRLSEDDLRQNQNNPC